MWQWCMAAPKSLDKALSFYFGSGANENLQALRMPHSDDEPSVETDAARLRIGCCTGSTEALQHVAQTHDEYSAAQAEDEELEDWRIYLDAPASKQQAAKSRRTIQQDGAAAAAETVSAFRKGKYTAGDGTVVSLKRLLPRNACASRVYSAPPLLCSHTVSAVSSCEVCIHAGGSCDAARWLHNHVGPLLAPFSIAMLDFASDSNPGGGWRGNQVGTQEEALCRASNLGVSLEQAMTGGAGIPAPFGAIYCPQIIVIREGSSAVLSSEPLSVAVIAAALRCCAHSSDKLDSKEAAFVEDKISSVLSVAVENGHRHLVLGAWGCGAFGNPPHDVAQAFGRALRRPIFASAFDAVIFGIPKGERFDVFRSVLGGLPSTNHYLPVRVVD